ncbi:MAG: transketolase [Subtercola sp.]|nr:transketolase [Subtercola sp.]
MVNQALRVRPADASTFAWSQIDDRAVAVARGLAMDAVERAGHGHPGTAMALAPVAHLLYQKFLRHDPRHPDWPARDRFVLSCGHASLTLYTQLFLTGYGVTLDDLRAYRTLGSVTPGHPERGLTPGVEMTTGPLGQGFASAVGIAMGARYERELFDPGADGPSPFDYSVFVLCSDGDIQEGVVSEASSLAAVQRLGNLVAIYDDNRISIEGAIDLSMSEDVAARYQAYGWHVQYVGLGVDGDVDVAALDRALENAVQVRDRPSFISLRTTIAWPAPLARGTSASHGSKLGGDEITATKRLLGLDPVRGFEVPDEVLEHTRQAGERGAALHRSWLDDRAGWAAGHPDEDALLRRVDARALPEGLRAALPVFEAGVPLATRKAFGRALQASAALLPELWGGSADLGDSNSTTIVGGGSFLPDTGALAGADGGGARGRNVHWGIREHAMASALNGITLAGRSRVFGGTYLVFSDYLRPAMRLAALMGLPVSYVFTHDTIGVGEDGPTHQPVEQLASLRTVPGLAVVRPGDANETAEAWLAILEDTSGPSALVLSRQDLPTYPRETAGFTSVAGVSRGAYVLFEPEAGAVVDDDQGFVRASVLLLATGSELQLAVDAAGLLAAEGVRARVVSVPCREWFDRQPAAYRAEVLPDGIAARVSVEAGVAFGWRDLVGAAGRTISVEQFGESASSAELFAKFGLTARAVADAARASIAEVAARGF